MKYSEQEMLDLINQVKDEFSAHLQKAEADYNATEEEKETIVEPIEETVEKSEPEISAFDEIKELYESLDKSEAQAHWDALNEVLQPVEEEVIEKSEPEEVEIEAQEEVMEKSEEDTIIGDIHNKLEKSQQENEELKKSLDKVVQVLNKMVKAPKAKAVTSMEYIAKSEPEEKTLTKTEINQILRKKAKEEISATDREKINDYYLNNGSFESIKHLVY